MRGLVTPHFGVLPLITRNYFHPTMLFLTTTPTLAPSQCWHACFLSVAPSMTNPKTVVIWEGGKLCPLCQFCIWGIQKITPPPPPPPPIHPYLYFIFIVDGGICRVQIVNLFPCMLYFRGEIVNLPPVCCILGVQIVNLPLCMLYLQGADS